MTLLLPLWAKGHSEILGTGVMNVADRSQRLIVAAPIRRVDAIETSGRTGHKLKSRRRDNPSAKQPEQIGQRRVTDVILLQFELYICAVRTRNPNRKKWEQNARRVNAIEIIETFDRTQVAPLLISSVVGKRPASRLELEKTHSHWRIGGRGIAQLEARIALPRTSITPNCVEDPHLVPYIINRLSSSLRRSLFVML